MTISANTAAAAARAVLASTDNPSQPAWADLLEGERRSITAAYDRSAHDYASAEEYYRREVVPSRTASMARQTAGARAAITLAAELRAARR